ncbi:MAG TPA: HAMP domain-containing sensor histidine kinase [Gaiellaceae bacterium]|nr:HAMP domain-containing sensor histidine kinase [Gaiellaceae bacterium]
MTSKRAWSALAAGAAAIVVYYLIPGREQSALYFVIGATSVVGIFVGVRRNTAVEQRLAWYLFTVGLALEVAGDFVGTIVYELGLNREPPVPGIDDVLYLAGYPFLIVAAFMLVQRLRLVRSGVVLDSLIVFLAVGLVQWVYFIDPYNHEGLSHTAERLVSQAYPAMDAFLLVAVGQLLMRYVKNVSFAAFIAGIASLIVADEVFAIANSGYAGLDWIDAFFLGSYVLLAFATLHPSVEEIHANEDDSARLALPRLVLLGGALLTAPCVLLAEKAAGHRTHLSVGIFGVLVALAVLLRIVGVLRDVESAHSAEQRARRESETAQQLLAVQNQRLRELDTLKDEFLSSVSHELRTPLTSIQGYVELLREDEGNPMKRGYLDIIERNSERLLGLVADVLFAARVLEGQLRFEFQPVDVARLVHQAVEEARPRATSAGIELLAHDGTAPEVDGEPARLSQLLDNLVSNAIKFTPNGGRVDVRTSAADGFVRIEVSDTGVGLSAADRDHLFERFFRSQTALERQIQGTGLGLYISRAIVEAHGGRIGVTSVEGEGTTFLVELPVRA